MDVSSRLDCRACQANSLRKQRRAGQVRWTTCLGRVGLRRFRPGSARRPGPSGYSGSLLVRQTADRAEWRDHSVDRVSTFTGFGGVLQHAAMSRWSNLECGSEADRVGGGRFRSLRHAEAGPLGSGGGVVGPLVVLGHRSQKATWDANRRGTDPGLLRARGSASGRGGFPREPGVPYLVFPLARWAISSAG